MICRVCREENEIDFLPGGEERGLIYRSLTSILPIFYLFWFLVSANGVGSISSRCLSCEAVGLGT